MDNNNNIENDSNNDVSIRFERASQRRHHRLTVPLGVKIKDQTYIALDWSTAGIRLRPYALKGKIKVDDVITLALSVPFHDFNVSLKLNAKVVRIDEENSDVAFTFINPPQRATELIRYFADHLIRGEMASIDGTIKRMDLPVTPPAPKPPPKAGSENGKNTQTVRSLFIGASYLMVGLIVAVGFYYTLYTNVFLVTSDQAFVYTPSVDVIVPEGGEVSAVYVSEGEQVSEGDPLLRLNSQRLNHLLSEAQFEIRAALNERRRLEASIKSEQETLATYRHIASDQVTAAEARLSSAKTQQSLLERQYERVSTMSQQDNQLVSTEELDRIRTDQLRATQAVSEAQAELRIARSAFEAAKKGAYYSSNRLESRLPTLQNDLASANDRIELAESRMLELQKQAIRLVIRAPVAGRVRQVTVPAGGTVMAGTQAVSLLTDQTLQVYTKIPSHELGRIAVGDSASVYVPVLSRNLNARVAAIEPRLWSLPNNVRRLLGEPSDGGLVVLSFDLLAADTGTELLNPGLPVTVELRNNTVRSVVRRVASLFHFSDTSATAIVPVSDKVTLAK